MIAGIDLGTTNSLIAVWRNGQSEVIPNALHNVLTPSVVGLDDKGRVIVGEAAKERLVSHPEKTVANIKRYMGTDTEVNLGGKYFRAEEISALIIKSLLADAREYLGEEVDEVVITVPAYFNDLQRKATKLSGELAGVKVERLLNEPTGAALVYGLCEKTESRYLIFDLGGGTFDVSIVEYFDGVLEVHASAGNNFLGGEDFMRVIYQKIIKDLVQKNSESEKYNIDPQLEQVLVNKAESIKKQLSKNRSGEVSLNLDGEEYSWKLDTKSFENMVQPLLGKITDPVKRALRDAKFKVSDLDEIILVGGATRMPVIHKLVTKLFERFPKNNLDPDQVVVMGAAIQAGLKARDKALSDTVMTDVCPYSLGVEVAEGEYTQLVDGFFLPIIERNSFIPISRVETVYTLANYQRYIEVKVFQGESSRVKENIFLGKLKTKVPKNKRGEESVDIRFTYDVNGILEVEVTIVSTKKVNTLVIEQNPGVLSKKEIAGLFKKLEKLKIHPREQLPNQVLISRADRIFQESLGDVRSDIREKLSWFLSVINKQDERTIREARKNFEEYLNEISSFIVQ